MKTPLSGSFGNYVFFTTFYRTIWLTLLLGLYFYFIVLGQPITGEVWKTYRFALTLAGIVVAFFLWHCFLPMKTDTLYRTDAGGFYIRGIAFETKDIVSLQAAKTAVSKAFIFKTRIKLYRMVVRVKSADRSETTDRSFFVLDRKNLFDLICLNVSSGTVIKKNRLPNLLIGEGLSGDKILSPLIIENPEVD